MGALENILRLVENGGLEITKVTKTKIEMRETDGSPGITTIQPNQDGWETFYVWRREHREKCP